MKGDAKRLALPVRLQAGWIGVVSRIERGELFSEHRFARLNLSNDGKEALAADGDAAIGPVVAKPGDLADAGVVIGQLESDGATGDAVDKKPGTALPDPLPWLVAGTLLVRGQSVVEADDAAHHKASIRYVVRVAGSPFLEDSVDQEGANFERVLAGRRAGGIAGLGIRDALDGAENDSVALAWSGGSR